MTRKLYGILSVVAILAVLAGCAAPVAPAPAGEAAPAGEEAAAAEGGVTINWATISGFYTDWAAEVAKDWEEQTGNTVNIIDIDLPQMYEKIVLESVADTGAYDIVTWDVGWQSEWANSGYLLELDPFIEAADPAELQLEDIAPSLLRTTGMFNGKYYGMPYYTFTMGMFYRCDLFEDEAEMAAFEEQYGYPLDIPTTYEQMGDIAEFFRREPGATLKGQPVEQDFYGIGLMASRDTNMQDELNSIVWTWGGDLILDDGSAGPREQVYIDAANFYVNELLPFAPPAALSSSYDEVVSQMRQGLIAMTGPFFLDQWPNAVKTEAEVEGAEVCVAPSPGGGRTWVGAFGIGVSNDSKNPEVAWDFLSYITGPEAQRKFAEGGGTTTRLSILGDMDLVQSNRATMGHFPTLVQILNHAEQCFFSNYFYVPQAGKIYEEQAVWNSRAASGEMPVEEAMNGMADSIEEICGGNCQIMKGDLERPPADCPFTFDRSAQLRKE
jgi:multiple sugar transport system substrate-binding protein